MASAEATATSTSEKPSRSKPVVKVISRGLCRMASAAIAVESMPPDRNAPTVTSARMCLATESSSTAVISSYRSCASSREPDGTGTAEKRGVKYRVTWGSPPARIRA